MNSKTSTFPFLQTTTTTTIRTNPPKTTNTTITTIKTKISLKMFLKLCNLKKKWYYSIALVSSLLIIGQTNGYQRYYTSVLQHLLLHHPKSRDIMSAALSNGSSPDNNESTPTTAATSSSSSSSLPIKPTIIDPQKILSTGGLHCLEGIDSPYPFYLPVGLKNLRNICYLNSILQSLYSLKAYSSSFLSLGGSRGGGTGEVTGGRQQRNVAAAAAPWKFRKDSFAIELQRLFQEMIQTTLSTEPIQNQTDRSYFNDFSRPIVNPLNIVKALKINIHEQEDAEELLLNLLNKVDESLAIDPASSPTGTIAASSSSQASSLTGMTSFLPSDVFQCQLNQFIYAMDHNNYLSSNKTLKYFDLSLSIDPNSLPSGGAGGGRGKINKPIMTHLNDCIHAYFQPEYFIGKNQYKCSKHGYTNAKKFLKILSFPKILIIHLKRFSFDPSTYQMKKITTPVEIPATLDLSPYAMKPDDFRIVKEKQREERNEGEKNSINKDENTPSEETKQISPIQDNDSNPDFFPNTISPTNNIGKYSLSAAVIHQGSIDHGHYFTLAKVAKNPTIMDEDKAYHWVQLNDHQVRILDEETVLNIATGEERINQIPRSIYEKYLGSDPVSSNAYLLFYTLQE